jgi:hypothetical protein
MNRRALLMGVAASAIAAGVPRVPSKPIWSFSAFVKRPIECDLFTGHWYHMVWSGDQFFLDGELAPPCDEFKRIVMDRIGIKTE